MTLLEQMMQTISQYRMLSPDDTVVVGLSGGADSVALLCALLTLRDQTGVPSVVAAAHMQHGLRGEESLADEEFVRQLCADLGVELFVKQADIAALAAQTGRGLEETGRLERYAFFEQAADRFPSAKIATAHHRGDNAETVLLHLTRGSGLEGLGGIAPVRGRVIRPLLDCSRTQIEAFCAERGLSYRQDSSNADVRFSRNRIRREVLPALEKINPAVEDALARLVRSARQDEEYLRQQADLIVRTACEGARYKIAPLAQAPTPIRLRALRQIAATATGITPEAAHTEALDALLDADGAYMLCGGCRTVSYHGYLYCPAPQSETFAPVVVKKVGKVYEICGKKFSFSFLSLEEWEKRRNVHKILSNNAIDCDMIGDSLILRPRRSGDLFRPVGRPRKTVKKWLSETGVPPWQREMIPLLCDEKGIVWIAGLGRSRCAAVSGITRRILLIEEV